MLDEIKLVKEHIVQAIEKIDSIDKLNQFKQEYLVKKGIIQSFFPRLKEVSKEDKPIVGNELNQLRQLAEKAYEELYEKLNTNIKRHPSIDLTLPGRTKFKGSEHPVLHTIREMVGIFNSLGFSVAEGPEIEDEEHNFDALNFPADHPARDMQDTFFVKSSEALVLRTHTSPVQIRVMQSQKPPIRCIMPGRVYRNESIDSTHLAEFHQIEGLYIDKNVTLAELKGIMILFAKKMYGEDLQFRFRPSFFPFTEPSAEMDVSRDGGKTWMEIVGCGLVHPNVLRAGGIDPDVYSGYAFGFGIERVTMLKTGLDDIRSLYENDIRVLSQF